jgi:DNA-binding transcriptional ArsR family regulator
MQLSSQQIQNKETPMAKKKPDVSETAKIKALTHPMRQRIMGVMVHRQTKTPISPREISATLQESLSNVSYHVRVLADCEAITLRRTKPVRGSMQHFYSPAPKFLALPWVPSVLKAIVPKQA